MAGKLIASPILKTVAAVLGPALTALNVYGVASQIQENYAGFQAARELRGLEWQQWKGGIRLTDLQDEIVEQRLRNWLNKHPEAIRPGMKIEDAIAQALGNLHNNRPPFENVVATGGDLSAERDKLRAEITEAKSDTAKATESLSKLQALRAEAAKTVQTWEQHQRDRTKILQDFAKMPGATQQQRQADIKRNATELETVKRELKTANERLNQIDDRIGVAKADLKSAEYHQKLKEDELKKVEERLAQLQRSGARP
jgi:chromosome segregation ATPase